MKCAHSKLWLTGWDAQFSLCARSVLKYNIIIGPQMMGKRSWLEGMSQKDPLTSNPKTWPNPNSAPNCDPNPDPDPNPNPKVVCGFASLITHVWQKSFWVIRFSQHPGKHCLSCAMNKKVLFSPTSTVEAICPGYEVHRTLHSSSNIWILCFRSLYPSGAQKRFSEFVINLE